VSSGVLAVRRTRSNPSANMPTANVATAHASAVATAARSTVGGSAASTMPLVRVWRQRQALVERQAADHQDYERAALAACRQQGTE
jgi:hypothetical protein